MAGCSLVYDVDDLSPDLRDAARDAAAADGGPIDASAEGDAACVGLRLTGSITAEQAVGDVRSALAPLAGSAIEFDLVVPRVELVGTSTMFEVAVRPDTDAYTITLSGPAPSLLQMLSNSLSHPAAALLAGSADAILTATVIRGPTLDQLRLKVADNDAANHWYLLIECFLELPTNSAAQLPPALTNCATRLVDVSPFLTPPYQVIDPLGQFDLTLADCP